MKTILTCLTCLFPLTLFAGSIYDNARVEVKRGAVMCAPTGEAIFTSSFEKEGVWNPKINNFREALKFEKDSNAEGKPSFRVLSEEDTEGDTAWSIVSNPIPFPEGQKRFILSFQAKTSVSVNGDANTGKMWMNLILWQNDQGKTCGELPFPIPINPGPFAEYRTIGEVPEDAKTCTIQFGFDTPNLNHGDSFELRDVELAFVDENRPYAREGWFQSGVLEGGKVGWTADVPNGTSVKFQVSSISSLEDENAKWSEFVGPDGTKNSFYTESFQVDAPWMRYRAYLTPNGIQTPVLRSVKVGEVADSPWTIRADFFPPRVKIVSATPTQDNRTPVVIEITDDSPVSWKSLEILIDDEDVTSRFRREGSKLVGDWKSRDSASEAPWTPGLHTVRVTVSDYNGTGLTAQKYFYIGDAPRTPRVTLRDDGMTLIGGQPFFPVGIYGVMEREFNDFDLDRAFAGLKEAGFNFAHSYSCPRTDKFLAAADKYGFKLWIPSRTPDERFIDVERHHPAILAWYLGDDTSANTTPAELYDRDDAVKSLDPTRLTTQADGVHAACAVSNYQDYVLGTDTFLPEIYPVRTLEAKSAEECVAQVIVDMKRCHADIALADGAPRGLWPIIQYFQGWGWKRFPTFDELNAMSFASIIHGANGITWYTYGGLVEPQKNRYNYGITTTPERWQNMATVATRIRDLAPVLLERTGEQPPAPEVLEGPKRDKLGNDSISILLKSHEGAAYLLCVNSSPEPVKVRFALTNVENTGTDLYENRDVVLESGAFVETFAGYAVHVYRFPLK